MENVTNEITNEVTNKTVSAEKPTVWTMSGEELFCSIVKRMAYTLNRRITKVQAAQVFTAISSLESLTDEQAMEQLNPMVLFEVATRIDGIIRQNGLEPYVIGANGNANANGKEKEKKPDGEENSSGDGKGAD